MTISKLDQNELPEFLVHGACIKFYKTADGTTNITLLAAGHHPKLRITRAEICLYTGAVQSQQTITKGDGTTTLVSGLNSGTTAGTYVAGTPVAGAYLDRNDALLLVTSAAGTTVLSMIVVEWESID